MIIIFGKSQNYLPDKSFGIDGIVKINKNNHYCIAYKIVQLQNKKYLCSSYEIDEKTNQSTYSIFRLNNDGSIDHTFGDTGFVDIKAGNLISKLDFTVYENNKILAIQPDINGKIELIFISENGIENKKYYMSPFPNNYIIPVKITLNNNKFLIGGNYNSKLDNREHSFIIKIDNEGNIDNSFADNGILKSENIIGKNKIFQDFSFSGENIFILTKEIQSDSNALSKLFKFNKNGNLDQTFSNDGVFQFQNNISYDSYNLFLSDDHIFIASIIFPILLKLNNEGKVDINYGISGWAQDDYILQKMSLPVFPILMKDNSILFSGTSKNVSSTQIEKAIISKYTDIGIRDQNFGESGIYKSNIDSPSIFLHAEIDKDNKLVLAGTYENTSNSNISQIFVSRYKLSSTRNNFNNYNTSLTIFPNPVYNKNLTVVFPENVSPEFYKIFDIYGKLIQEGSFENTASHSNEFEIRLSDNISANIYIMQVLGDDLDVLLKFQKF
jgi:uncharacterized delta-60 repeat protein